MIECNIVFPHGKLTLYKSYFPCTLSNLTKIMKICIMDEHYAVENLYKLRSLILASTDMYAEKIVNAFPGYPNTPMINKFKRNINLLNKTTLFIKEHHLTSDKYMPLSIFQPDIDSYLKAFADRYQQQLSCDK